MTAAKTATMTSPEDKLAVVTWAAMVQSDVGVGVNIGRYADRTVQVTGTFGSGGGIDIEGSPDGTTWGRCHDAWGNLIRITDNTPFVIGDNPVLIRPKVNSGDGTTSLIVTVSAVMRSF